MLYYMWQTHIKICQAQIRYFITVVINWNKWKRQATRQKCPSKLVAYDGIHANHNDAIIRERKDRQRQTHCCISRVVQYAVDNYVLLQIRAQQNTLLLLLLLLRRQRVLYHQQRIVKEVQHLVHLLNSCQQKLVRHQQAVRTTSFLNYIFDH